MADIQEFLKIMIEKGASDLHIAVDSPPLVRINGELTRVALSAADADRHQEPLLQPAHRGAKTPLRGGPRARLLLRGSRCCPVPRQFLPAEGLRRRRLPRRSLQDPSRSRSSACRRSCTSSASSRAGSCWSPGRPASGKSTTLASMVDKVNMERREHVITVEDPIEFVHESKRCLVNQREVFADTKGFNHALRHVLRQDPDIVLIGEMRDLETIEAALVVAETGHLVFSTLHTNSAVQTINRVIDVFPPYQQPQVRAQLSVVLEGVISQQLHPAPGRQGPRARRRGDDPEPAIRNLIREQKVHQIYSQMQVGQAKHGMQTMSQSLVGSPQPPADLLRRGAGSRDRAGRAAYHADRRPNGREGDRDAVHAPRLTNFEKEAERHGSVPMGRDLAQGRGHAGRDGGTHPRRSDRAAAHAAHSAASGQDQGKGQGARSADQHSGSRRNREDTRHRGLHAAVRDDDRRRPADRAVPRHPAGADHGQAAAQGDPADQGRRRGGSLVQRGPSQAPEALRRALHQHGRSRRSRRYPRQHHEPAGRLHGEGRAGSGRRSRAR